MRAPGELLTVEGRTVHVIRAGEGSPAVVFEAGAGQLAYSWRRVQRDVAEFTSTLAWDRPGYGWSAAPAGPLDIDSVCDTLLTTLGAAALPAPYVLVGHSLAGYYVRRFIAMHPEKVAGAVLVDPSHERQLEPLPRAMRAAARAAMWIQGKSPGLVRRIAAKRYRTAAGSSFPELSSAELDELVAIHLRSETLRLQFAELKTATAQARDLPTAPGAMGDLPLIVLGAGRLPGGENFRRHREEVQLPHLAALSTRGRLRIVADSGHGIPQDSPAAVVEAVREVVEQARRTGSAAGIVPAPRPVAEQPDLA